MCNFFHLLCFSFLISLQLSAQVSPKEGSDLNYRLIGFEFPQITKGSPCKLEIADGNYYSADSFKQNMIRSLDCTANKVIAEVPAFGKTYTWHIVSGEDKAARYAGGFHHFSTAMITNVDTNITRLRVLKRAEAYKDDYVFIDGSRVLYDMSGSPVWFLPNIEYFPNENFEVRNMELTPQGTITFIIGETAYEVNYNAEVLWRSTEATHHQVTRLPDGHYMVLGNEDVLCKRPAPGKDKFEIAGDSKAARDSAGLYTKVPFGTMIEYDEKGNVVWSWRSSKYFKGSDIAYHKKANGAQEMTTHENAFYFDEKTKTIYVSFRNISRILKLKYPEGDVINTYGEKYEPGIPEKGNGLFCSQHSCRISEQGYLYLFNNNVCNPGALPTILMMQETATEKGGLKKVWEYECRLDGISDSARKISYQFKSGGNVIELPGGAIFSAMSAPFYSNVFIVNHDKHILWSAVPEKKNPMNDKWEMTGFYEAGIIQNKEDLEHLIWHAGR